MSRLYIPSGKYLPYAPVVFMLILLVCTGLCGYLYGRFFSSFIRFTSHAPQGVDLFTSLLALLFFMGVLVAVTTLLIRVFKIRNPALARRWTWCVSIAGWSLNWLVGLYIALGSDPLVVNGLLHGTPAIIIHLDGLSLPNWINWCVLLLSLIFEVSVVPLFFGHFAFKLAFMLFSEKKVAWYGHPIRLPLCMHKEPTLKKMIKKRVETDDDWVEASRPNFHWYILGFTADLFFPEHPHDNIYFSPLYRAIPVAYGITSIPFAQPNSFWIVTAEQAEILINKFDPKKITDATKLLNKYRLNSVY